MYAWKLQIQKIPVLCDRQLGRKVKAGYLEELPVCLNLVLRMSMPKEGGVEKAEDVTGYIGWHDNLKGIPLRLS